MPRIPGLLHRGRDHHLQAVRQAQSLSYIQSLPLADFGAHSYTNMDAWNFHRNSAWTRKALADGKTEPVIKVLTGQVVGYDGGLGLALAPVVAEEAGLAVEELKPMSVVAASA